MLKITGPKAMSSEPVFSFFGSIKCNQVQLSAIGSDGLQSRAFGDGGCKGHAMKHRKGGSGVPPLIFHSHEAGRLFHFIGKKMGAKGQEQAIIAALSVHREWQTHYH
jgi:hypothetical protein